MVWLSLGLDTYLIYFKQFSACDESSNTTSGNSTNGSVAIEEKLSSQQPIFTDENQSAYSKSRLALFWKIEAEWI